jgi:hypothetical protein
VIRRLLGADRDSEIVSPDTIHLENFEVRHPRCVSTKSNYKVYAYIVKHNYTLGGMLFTICKAQLHVSATNVGHLQVVQ